VGWPTLAGPMDVRTDWRRDGADAGVLCDGEYDLAGFIVGAVDRDKMVTGAGIKAGDVLIGLPSTGLHTNGYSLARKLLFEVAGYKPTQYVTAIKEKAGAALMKTHRSYLHVIQKLVTAGLTTGMAHITGGGITENLPRILPKNTGAQIEIGSWPVLPIFEHLRDAGAGIARRDDAHVQYGRGADCGDSGGEVYAREESSGPGGREVPCDWARGEG
jgi:phosphoribosylaminoimidazole (AIR) synthetase